MRKERRSFPRIPYVFDGRCRMTGVLIEGWSSVTVMNIGAGGMRVRSADGLLEPASVLDFKLPVPGLADVLVVRGRVAWTAMPAAGVIEAGVEFLELSLPQKAMLDRLVSFMRRG